MRPVMGMTFAAASVLVLAGGPVQAQSLTSVPDNAIVMVKVNNLEQTSQKLGAMLQQWGVTAFNPALADPLVALEGMANLQQGLNRAGEGAFIMVNPMNVAGGQGAAPVIIMLPVSDYDAFIKNFPDAQADGELTMVTIPVNNETGYVAKWGSFAAISPNRALVAKAPKATKFTGLAAKEMQSRDIVAYVNFAGIRNQAAGGLSFARGAVIGQIDQQLQQQPDKAKYAPVAVAAMNQIFNGLDHVVNETQAMTIGLDITKTGMQFTQMTEFVPESYLAKLVTGWKPQDTKLIAGLPDGKYFAAGGVAFDSNTMGQLVSDIVTPIRDEAQAIGDPGKPIVGYLDAIKTAMTSSNSQSFGISPGEGEAGKSPLFDMVVITHGDVDKLTAAQHEIAQYQQQFTQLLQPPGQPQTTTQIKQAAKSVSGVTFDEMTTNVEMTRPNSPEQKIMELFYGPGGFSMLMGKIGPDTMLSTSYKQDAQIEKAITAAKAGTDPLAGNTQVKEISAALPPNPTFVMYMFPGQAMEMASRASMVVAGVPLQTKLPPDVQPIAISGATEGTAVKTTVYIPSSVVQAGIQVGMQEAMHQQQQQQQRPRPQRRQQPAAPGAAPANPAR